MTLPLIIDDFTSGLYTTTLTTVGVESTYVGGASIRGGARYTNLLNSFDPRHTPVTLDVGSVDRLNVTTGAKQLVRIEVGYGFTPTGEQAPLGLDLVTAGASAIRTSFESVNGVYPLNYNVVIFTADGGIASFGANLAPSPDPFVCDFLLRDFTGGGETGFFDVSFLDFIIQTSADLSINSFEII